MAIYFTDFSDTEAGTAPSDWGKGSDTAFTIEVLADAGAIGGKHFRMRSGGSSATDYRALCIPTLTMADRNRPEILAKLRLNTTTDRGLLIWRQPADGAFIRGLRCTLGTIGATTDYFSHVRPGGASSNAIVNVDIPRTPEWFWVRTKHDATNIRMKFWADGDPEPEAFSAPTTLDLDTGYSTELTYGGFYGRLGVGLWLDCDYYAFATEGDEAPGPIPLIIDDVIPSDLTAASNPVITGTRFGAVQGTGSVKISPTNNVADVNAVTQTINTWSDLEITLTGVSFPAGTTNDDLLHVFVTNDASDTTAAFVVTADLPGFPVTEPLYFGATLLNSRTGIHWKVTEGHGNLIGATLGSGTTGTTDAFGVFIFPAGTEAGFGADGAAVTMFLYWTEGDPAVDRSLIVKTTLAV